MIVLRRGLSRKMVRHAEGEAPREACGILAGIAKRGKVVEKVYPCRNADPSPLAAYTIDPKELLAVLEEIEGSGMELLGFYHSHSRGPEFPSGVDSARANWPGHSVICQTWIPWCANTLSVCRNRSSTKYCTNPPTNCASRPATAKRPSNVTASCAPTP